MQIWQQKKPPENCPEAFRALPSVSGLKQPLHLTGIHVYINPSVSGVGGGSRH